MNPQQQNRELDETQPTQKNIRRKIWFNAFWWVVGITNGILCIVISLQLLFRYYTDEIVGTVLKEIIELKSDGLYQLEYLDIDFNFIQNEVRISELALIPNRQVYHQLKNTRAAKNKLYAFQIKKIHIDGLNLRQLYFDKRLKLDEFTISDFNFIIEGDKTTNETDRNKAFKMSNPYFLISGILKELHINNVNLSQGAITYRYFKDSLNQRFEEQTIQLEHISLQAKTLSIDSLSSEAYPFQIENLSISLGKNKVRLPNEKTVSFDTLYVGADQQLFTAANLTLLNQEQEEEISIPQLKFTGIDYLNAYLTKQIAIDTLQLHKPILRLDKVTQKNNQQNEDVIIPDLYKGLSRFAYTFSISKCIVEEAILETQTFLGTVPSVSLTLHQVLIDSATHQEKRPFAYSDSLELSISDIKSALPDSLHRLNVGNIILNTGANVLSAKNIALNPRKNAMRKMRSPRIQQSALVTLSIPEINVQAIDLWEILYDKKLDAHTLTISNPSVKVFSVQKEQESKGEVTLDPENLYPLIEDQLERIQLDRVRLKRGSFLVNRQLSKDSLLRLGVGEMSIFLNSFEISKASAYDTTRLLQSKDALIEFQKGFLDLPDTSHRITVGSGRISLRDSVSEWNSIAIMPRYGKVALQQIQSDAAKTYVRASIPNLLFSNTQLRNLLLDQQGNLGKVRLVEPDITIFQPLNEKKKDRSPPSVNSALTAITGQQFKIDSGKAALYTYGNGSVTAQFSLPKLSTTLNQISFDSLATTPQQALGLNELTFETENYNFMLPDSIHRLNAGYVYLSSKEKLFTLKEVSIVPRNDKTLAPRTSQYNLKTPELRFAGFEVGDFLQENRFSTDSLIIGHSTLTYALFNGDKQKKGEALSWEELPKMVSENFPKVEVGYFLLDSSKLSLYVRDTLHKATKHILAENVLVSVKDFKMEENTLPSIFRPLYSSSAKLSMGKTTYVYPEGEVSWKALEFHDQLPAKININGFNVSSTYPVSTKRGLLNFGSRPQYAFSAAQLVIDSLNVYALLTQKNLLVDNIDIHQFSGKIRTSNQKKEIKKPVSFHSDSLRIALQSIFPKVEVNTLTIKQGEVDMLFDATTHIQKETEEVSKKSFIVLHHDKEKITFADTLAARKVVIRHSLKIPEAKQSRLTFNGIEGSHTGLSTDTLLKSSSKVLLQKQINYTVKHLGLEVPDTTFLITAENLIFNTDSTALSFENIRATHKISPNQLFDLRGTQTDWMNFTIKKITCEGIDIEEIANVNAANVNSIHLHSPEGKIFRDKNYPFPKGNNPPMPQEAIRNLPLKFNLQTLEVSNGAITYNETAEKEVAEADSLSILENAVVRTGSIQFRNMKIKAEGLTNIPEELEKKPKTTIEASAMLMGSGQLKVTFSIDLLDPKNTYSFEGELDSMLLPQLNPMLEKLAYLNIRSGLARRLRFWVSANEEYAVGKMRFLYNNLSISLVDKTYKVGAHEYIFSLLANTFLIRQNNSRFFLFYKGGKIYAPKDDSRSVFNHWAKALLSGVRSSITSWQPKEGKQLIKEWEKENRKLFKR